MQRDIEVILCHGKRPESLQAIVHFTEKMPDTTRQHAIRANIIKRRWISPLQGAGGVQPTLCKNQSMFSTEPNFNFQSF